jgi:hypothetical protein
MGYEMTTEAIRGDWIGRVIDGRFTLIQWLGGSELGAVFLTVLPGDGSRKAAIKLIPADAADAEARLAGWVAASTLSHPHLMRIFHYGRCQIGAVRLLYAVTEYADEILAQILLERPLTPPRPERCSNRSSMRLPIFTERASCMAASSHRRSWPSTIN